jgi:uncharacterized protein
MKRQKIIGIIMIMIVLLFFFMSVLCIAKTTIPPPVKPGTFVNDYAGIISSYEKEEIGKVQKRAFIEDDTPIMIVTLQTKAMATEPTTTIEELAKTWFNKWGIGKRDPQGKTINKGILILVLLAERQVRIELGAEWGHKWNNYCQAVVNDFMVPKFKEGKYSAGLLEAVKALDGMAKMGPAVDPPHESLTEVIARLIRNPQAARMPTSLFSGQWLILLIAIGIFCIIFSFFLPPDYSKMFLMIGLGVISLAMFTWVWIIIMAILGVGSSSSSGTSEGFVSSGGFDTGGFSGGGGATGSW